jgi:hypothetical protein
MQQQSGLGLAELLIGLFLSSFTMMLMMNQYLNTKKQHQEMQKILEREMDLLVITDLMRDSFRKAGFTPCSILDNLMTRGDEENKQRLTGVNIRPTSIQLSRMSERFDTVTAVETNFTVYATRDEIFQINQRVLIADCYHAEVKEIAQVRLFDNVQKISFVSPLTYSYQKPVYMGEWINETYYTHVSLSHDSSLFYKFRHAEELMSGVHSLIGRLEEVKGQKLLRVTLGFNQNHQVDLNTMVRTN